MARIHGVDWRAAGLGDLDPGADGGSRLSKRLSEWERYLAWASEGRSQPVPEAAVAWLRDNLPADESPPALCWGDSRIGNQLFVDHRVVAVLDWEMVHIGDPAQDLAWFVWLDRHHSEGLGVPRLPGFPSYADTVARWEAATGRSAGDFVWHQVQAGLGFAAVMVRLASLLAAFDLLPPDADFERTNTGVLFLQSELERLGVM
jgi:aminoglycoside phosphotransferase (APT) family kinase protein